MYWSINNRGIFSMIHKQNGKECRTKPAKIKEHRPIEIQLMFILLRYIIIALIMALKALSDVDKYVLYILTIAKFNDESQWNFKSANVS